MYAVIKTIADQDKNVHITESVINIFKKYQQKSNVDIEACGILMCSIDKGTDDIYIHRLTEPKEEDIRKRFFFFLKDFNHQKELDRFYEESAGTTFLCGTWHTHPEATPTASKLDISEWKKFIKKNTGLISSFYFIIVGIETIALYTYRDGEIRLLEDKIC